MEKRDDPLIRPNEAIRKRLRKFEAAQRRRRWFSRFLFFSLLIGFIGLAYWAGIDRIRAAWQRFSAVLRQGLPDSAEKTRRRPSGEPSFSVQTGKLENEDEYREFLGSIPLEYISPEEVIRPHRNVRNGVKNELPPKRYWKRIRETLLAADAIRKELGVPLRIINSAFRSPEYNAECSGAVANSYHTKNMALDLIYACEAKDAALAARKLRSQGVFKGGIGVYSTFIHIDTRGRNADWGLPLEVEKG